MVALKGTGIDAFVNKPDAAARLVLVYGPDSGLVSERARLLLRAYAAEPDDPFSVSKLDESDISADPARLADEAGAMTLSDARRVVTLANAGAASAAALEHVLGDGPGDAVMLVSAGALRPTAKLRKLAEKSPRCFALPCYLDEDGALDRMIDDEIAECNLTITADARRRLRDLLGADRGLSRQEVRKLCLFALDGPQITLGDVEEACGDVAEVTLDRVCDAAFGGRMDELERGFTRAIAEGMSPVRLLGALARQAALLQRLAADQAAGKSISDAIRGLRPPLHFKRRDRITAQLRLWRLDRLERLARDIYGREALCRNSAIPAEAQTRQTFLSIAASAGKTARRRG